MDKVARRAGNEDHAKGVPLQLTNYQAPIGMFIIFNISAIIVFCIELFKEKELVDPLNDARKIRQVSHT